MLTVVLFEEGYFGLVFDLEKNSTREAGAWETQGRGGGQYQSESTTDLRRSAINPISGCPQEGSPKACAESQSSQVNLFVEFNAKRWIAMKLERCVSK